jgi:hypothetical protein
MKSNVRHTFRPNLEPLEGRLVPSWSMGVHNGAAVLTAATPAAAFPPAVGLRLADGPTTVVTAAGQCSGHFCKVDAPTMAASVSEIVVTKPQDDIVLHRVPDLTTPAGSTTLVTAAPDYFLKINGVSSESISLNFSKIDPT